MGPPTLSGRLHEAWLFHPVGSTKERIVDMTFWEFITSWYFFTICAVLLVALIGVFFYLRKSQSED